MSDDAKKYPHVYDWQRPIVEEHGEQLVNTGGNDPLELLDDLQGGDKNMMRTNIVRYVLAEAVSSQVSLLRRLEPKGSTVIGFYDGELPIVVGVVAGNVDVNGGHNGWSLWADHVEESDPEQAAIDAVGARLSRDMGQGS